MGLSNNDSARTHTHSNSKLNRAYAMVTRPGINILNMVIKLLYVLKKYTATYNK